MFGDTAMQSHEATARNWVDQVFDVGLMVLVGCSMAAMLAIGTPPSAGDTQVTMPASEWLFGQPVLRASRHEPLAQRLLSPVKAPVGQGWG